MRRFGPAVSPSNSSLPGRKNCGMGPQRSCFPTHWTRPQPLSLPMAFLVSQRPALSQLSSVEDRSDLCITQCISSCLGRGQGRSEASCLQSSKVHIYRPSPSLFHASSTSLLFTRLMQPLKHEPSWLHIPRVLPVCLLHLSQPYPTLLGCPSCPATVMLFLKVLIQFYCPPGPLLPIIKGKSSNFCGTQGTLMSPVSPP